jgi:PKD repeat protein
MKNLFFKTIIVIVLFLFAKPVFGNMIINEIMYDLETGSDSGREWVEIFNNKIDASIDASIDLTGWKFWENGTNHGLTLFQGSAIIPSSGYAIIADNPEKFLIDNPGYSGTIFDSAFSLSNDGESLILKDNNLITINEVVYDSAWGAQGNGRSLQREDPNSSNWGSGIPTIGTLNSISLEPEEEPTSVPDETSETPEVPEIPTNQENNSPPVADAGDNIVGFVDQEILFDGLLSFDPDGNELSYSWNTGDGNSLDKMSLIHKYFYPGTYLVTLTVFDGKYYASDTITVQIQQAQITINEFMANPSGTDTEEEWIEVYNGADSISDISGWQLDDITSGSKAVVFPQNTLIAPKSYLVFSRRVTKIALNNDVDSVRLLMPDGTVFQEINYEKPPQGKSSARTEEGFVWSEPTPGMANISGFAINPEKKTVSQMNVISSQTVKESSKEYVIDLPKNDISGGYIEGSTYAKASVDELAFVKQGSQNPLNLVLLIVCVVFGAGFLGFLLIKFRKRKLPT